MDALDRQKLWETHITVAEGDMVQGGTIIAEVPETRAIVHKCMVPPGVEGTVVSVVPDGEYTIDETRITIELFRRKTRTFDDTALADPCTETGEPEIPGKCAAGNRTANSGYDVPDCKRWNGCDPGRIRNG